MKTKTYLKVLVLSFLVFGLTVSCEQRDDVVTDDLQTNDVVNEDLLETDDLALTAKPVVKKPNSHHLGLQRLQRRLVQIVLIH